MTLSVYETDDLTSFWGCVFSSFIEDVDLTILCNLKWDVDFRRLVIGGTNALLGVRTFVLLLVFRSFFLLCRWYLEDRRLDGFKPTVFVGFAKRPGELLFTAFDTGLFNMLGDALPRMDLPLEAFDSGVWKSPSSFVARTPKTHEIRCIVLEKIQRKDVLLYLPLSDKSETANTYKYNNKIFCYKLNNV